MDEAVRCCKGLFGRCGTYYHRCYRKGVVARDGKHYCKQHDPVAAQERRRARDNKLQAQWDAREKAEKRRRSLDRAEQRVINAAKRWTYNTDSKRELALITAVQNLERLVFRVSLRASRSMPITA